MSTPAPLPIFDKLAKISEAHYPSLVKLLDKAKLFLFPGKPHDVLPRNIPVIESQMLLDNFFLPFDVVAVEDAATCTVLMDSVEDQIGCSEDRYFIDCCPVFSSMDNFNDDPEKAEMLNKYQESLRQKGLPKDACVVTVGRLSSLRVEDETTVWVEGSLDVTFMASKHTLIIPPMGAGRDDAEEMTAAALKHARAAVEEIMYFNTPARFICEREPKPGDLKRKLKHGQTRRSNARPIYTALTPPEIKDKFQFTDDEVAGTGSKKAPHWRRRHKRMLSSDRYKEMKGKVVTVKAHWVGPEEAEVKGHHWRVRLDL